MRNERIFQEACLIQLSISCWMGSKKLEPSVMEELGSSTWLAGRKHLINPEVLNPIKAVAARARVFLERSALPFPLKGFCLIPKEMLNHIDMGLEDLKYEFMNEVRAFEGRYAEARAEAERSLGDLFSESDYPNNISKKFAFDWRFLTLDVPGKNSILTPQMYENEVRKFQEMIEETRELAISALRTEFSEMVHHMTERLTGQEDGKPKQFKSSMIEKLRDFMSSFSDRNLFDDQKLAELVAETRLILDGVTPEMLRCQDDLRKEVKTEMDRVKTAINEAMEDLPRRRIRMAA